MAYGAALAKAWEDIGKLSGSVFYSVPFMGEKYEIDVDNRMVCSAACNIPVKDQLVILLLHYVSGSLRGGYSPGSEWLSFKDIEGGEIYYPAFREGAIAILLKKFGRDPQKLLSVMGRIKGRKVEAGDGAIEFNAFKGVPVRIVLWEADEEFEPEITILFDSNISRIFPMEDIAVFSRLVAHSL
ncbi:MAG: DUF3786 domain-containing protein [Candidatus Omnitrophota bacterium]|jgi:hypothetical protein